jgi:hypothetical protein
MSLVFTMSTNRSIAWRGKQTELLTANQTAGFNPGNPQDLLIVVHNLNATIEVCAV